MNPKAFFYWLVVALPLSWGLYKAIEKSVPLFSDKVAAAPAVVAPAAATPVPALVVTPAPAAPAGAPAASPAATP